MESSVADPSLAEAFKSITAGIDQVFDVGINPVDSADAIVIVKVVECLTRRMQAMQNDTLTSVEQRGLHRHDGHATGKVFVRHHANLSDCEAAGRAKTSRALLDLPEVADAFRAGDIGRPQTDCIARAHANQRVRERLCAQDQQLAESAHGDGYRLFDGRLRDWVRQTDEDGTCDQSQRNHENRDASLI